MDLQKTKTVRGILAICSLLISIAGLVLIGVLSVAKDGTVAVTFGSQINKLIELFQSFGSSGNPAEIISQSFFTLIIIFLYVVTYITGLVYVITSIVNIARINKEGFEKRHIESSVKLSYVLLTFYALLVFFTYTKGGASDYITDVGGYVGFGCGALAAVLTGINYFLSSEKPAINKVLRICLMLVGYAAAVFALMPFFTVDGAITTPAKVSLGMLAKLIAADTSGFNQLLLTISVGLFAVLLIASSFAYTVGYMSVTSKAVKKGQEPKEAHGAILIILSAIAAVLVAGSVFGIQALAGVIPSVSVTIDLYAYVAFGLAALTLVLAIIVAVLAKNEKVEKKEEAPVEEAKPEEEQIEAEPAEEPVEESEEEAKEEVATMVIVADAVTEEQEEAPVEEAQPEEKKPAEKKSSVKKAEPSKKEEKKPATKKAEPAKKAEEPKAEEKKPAEKKALAKKQAAKKEEPKEPKKNASYHISKRASDNKWQVFRAGSDKVIKLFDTKVEAEEYTKRMAENQGVSYLSHASKGKNKGKIQKK